MNFEMRPILEFPGYFAGSDGNIYSYWVTGPYSRIDLTRKPKRLKQANHSRYYHVGLVDSKGAHSKDVHKLVCIAFYGPRPSKDHTVSHLDGNNKNNRADNLLWETYSENFARKLKHGTSDSGHRNSRAHLEVEKVLEIKELLKRGEFSYVEIGKRFQVDSRVVGAINRGERYKY